MPQIADSARPITELFGGLATCRFSGSVLLRGNGPAVWGVRICAGFLASWGQNDEVARPSGSGWAEAG
jgi:hypothetical protein